MTANAAVIQRPPRKASSSRLPDAAVEVAPDLRRQLVAPRLLLPAFAEAELLLRLHQDLLVEEVGDRVLQRVIRVAQGIWIGRSLYPAVPSPSWP